MAIPQFRKGFPVEELEYYSSSNEEVTIYFNFIKRVWKRVEHLESAISMKRVHTQPACELAGTEPGEKRVGNHSDGVHDQTTLHPELERLRVQNNAIYRVLATSCGHKTYC